MLIVFVAVCLFLAAPAFGQAPISYRLSFPDPQHHSMQVEVTFPDAPEGALQVLMSRTSPGRYAIHDFAKNVYDVQVDDGAGQPLSYTRPNPSQWDVASHRGTVRMRYKVFGDVVDGTNLAIDTTHAHINIPAALLWARGLEERAVNVTFEAAAGWNVATQLKPTSDPRTFTAPNLYYLIDSPTELSAFTLRSFNLGPHFRIALHHEGSDRDADRFAAGVEQIVQEQRAIFGEWPPFEAPYTFIADFLPYAGSDGMEHRNSTILTGALALSEHGDELEALSTAAHEFFHSWNVERIRPRSLEPFRLDGPNTSGELWFAEGFTSYYEPLTMHRAGLADISWLAGRLGSLVDTVVRSPARKYITAEESSRRAQFTDRASWGDPTNFDNTFLSYYTWGAAIGLGLDLELRARTNHAVTLDDVMRRMWREFGSATAPAEGTVARPYDAHDLQRVLGEVSGDSVFARQFFDRYIHGHDAVDYGPLLARAGFLLRRSRPEKASIGPVALAFDGGAVRVVTSTIEGTPLHTAGVDRGDALQSFDGVPIDTPAKLEELVQRHRPGDRVRMTIRRRGTTEEVRVTIGEDPALQIVPIENTGRQLTPAEKAFRAAWLGSKK